MTRRELVDPFGSDDDDENSTSTTNENNKSGKPQINPEAANVSINNFKSKHENLCKDYSN
jgi:hypothetical protein